MTDLNKDSIVDLELDVDLETEERDDAVIASALKWSLVVLVVLGSIGGGFAWWLTRPEPPPPITKTELTLPEIRERPPVQVPTVKFTDITGEANITFFHENGAHGKKLLPETMGGGCAFLDYDNDGDQDILLVNSKRWPSDKRPTGKPPTTELYRNDGTGTFENVTADSGLNVTLYGMGVACGDYDNDGNVDVFISAVGPNRLFRNIGGKFVDVTDEAGLTGDDDAWGTSCGFFDYDNDGDLDVFVCNYVRWSRESDLSQNFTLDGKVRAYGRPQDFKGTYCSLYRNENGKFTDVSAQAGIHVNNPATGMPMAKSLGVAFADFDSDGHLDIVVANDTVQNFLFRNRGDGKFEECGTLCGVAFDLMGNARGAMGIDIASFRNNDSLGIVIGNFANETIALYVSQAGATGEMPQFTDEAESNGIRPLTRLVLTFGVFFFDCDLDGRLDLFAANGHLEEDINLVQASQYYHQPPQLLWNCGPEHKNEFVTLSSEQCGEDFTRRMVGRGSTFADIDNDGDLDVLITGSGHKPRLLRNDQNLGHHWLRLKITGSKCNRDAIGALVEVEAGGKVLRRQVMPTRSYLSQSELPITFGLGKTDEIQKVTIYWPDGSTQVHLKPEIDRLIYIEQQDEYGTNSVGRRS